MGFVVGIVIVDGGVVGVVGAWILLHWTSVDFVCIRIGGELRCFGVEFCEHISA